MYRIDIMLAFFAAICGFVAAYKWYAASGEMSPPYVIPDELTTSNMAEIAQIKFEIEKSSKLNRTAASWSAAAAVLTGVSTFVGVFFR